MQYKDEVFRTMRDTTPCRTARGWTKAFGLGLILLLVSACVTTQDFRNLQNQMASLRQSQQQNQRRTQNRLDTLEKSIQQVEREAMRQISNSTSPVRSTQANLWSEIESQRIKLATIKGRQENLRVQMDRVLAASSNSTERIEDIEARLDRIESDLNLLVSQLGIDLEGESSSARGASPEPADQAGGSGQKEQTPRILYDQALSAFQERNYAEAQSMWAEFIESFPKHDLVPNSHFWQGESFYQMQKYRQAVLSYQQVIENHADSNKYPAALLKQGLSFYRLDKNKAGRIVLQELIQKYPDRAEAKRAERFLKKR